LSFRFYPILLLLIASPLLLLAQRKNDDLNYHIQKTPTPILIDGVIDVQHVSCLLGVSDSGYNLTNIASGSGILLVLLQKEGVA